MSLGTKERWEELKNSFITYEKGFSKMDIIQFPTPIPMTTGVYPNLKSAVFGDSLAAVTAPGYLNQSALTSVLPLSTKDIIFALYSFNKQTERGTSGSFNVNINSATGQITLSPTPVSLPKSNGTEVANLVTTSAVSGIITTSTLNIPPVNNYVITWNNPNISLNPQSSFGFSIQGGTADPYGITFLCKPTAPGTALLAIYNGSSVALSGTMMISYTIL